MRPLTRLFSIALSLLLTIPTAAEPERWYVLQMQGQRAGWLVEREHKEDDRITSEARTHLTLRRADTSIILDVTTTFTETAEGHPISMAATTNFGGGVTTDHYEFTPDGIHWSHTHNGLTETKALPAPQGRWLPPAAASRYVAKRLEARADTITLRTLDPLNGVEPVVTTRTSFETVTLEVMGRTAEAIRCDARSSLYPEADGLEFIDDRGRLLRSEMKLGAMTITILAADEQLATADIDPPELMRAVFIKPDRPIADPYLRTRAVFTVTATEGSLPDLPTTGTQRAERLDDSTIRITRDVTAPPLPDARGPQPTTDPTAMLNADDPRVVELTRTALALPQKDPRARAETLRNFVHRHIRTKDLSVGFASAAETARTREGDCTEHAVLLAAMLRADGIPARVVSGLIYADRFAGGEDIFGYHMWTQAFLPQGPDGQPRWTDLDATLPHLHPRLTATHIALALSNLPDTKRINALVELAPLMGRLAIKVESVE